MFRRTRVRLLPIAWALLCCAAPGQTQQTAPAPAKVPPQPPPPPGTLVDIGGHRLHLLCTGEGTPTVLLESGLGAYSVDWSRVQPIAAGFTRVCSYDRASYAWSEPGPEPRGLRTSVDELHRLLERAGIAPPCVVVGQSWGGRIVRLFAHTYPREVAGMVLIDTFSEGTAEAPVPLPDPGPSGGREEGDPAASLPPPFREAHAWAAAGKRQPDITDVNEDPDALIRSTSAGGNAPLGDRPLVVISAGRLSAGGDPGSGPSQKEKLRAHVRSQAFLATLSRNSRFLMATRSFHEVHLYEPELVAGAIRQVVDAVRSGRRLDAPVR